MDKSLLHGLDLPHVCWKAAVDVHGVLHPVAGIDSAVRSLLGRGAVLAGVTVLVVAENQDGVPHLPLGKPHVLLPPRHPSPTGSSASPREPASLLVLRAGSVSEAIERVYELEAATVLSLLAHPATMIEYGVAGNLPFLLLLLTVLGASWYLLPGAFFLLPPLALLVLPSLLALPLRLRRGSLSVRLPPGARRPLPTWCRMFRTASRHPSYGRARRFIASSIAQWLCASLCGRPGYAERWLIAGARGARLVVCRVTHRPAPVDRHGPDEHVLSDLPWIWRRRLKCVARWVLVFTCAAWLLSPFQHWLAERLPPCDASLLVGGDSQLTWSSGVDVYAPVQVVRSTHSAHAGSTETNAELSTAVWSAGKIELLIADKPRTLRRLRVTTCDRRHWYLRRSDGRRGREVETSIPIVDGRATFEYGSEPEAADVWDLCLMVELLDHEGNVLDRGVLHGVRQPVIVSPDLWRPPGR